MIFTFKQTKCKKTSLRRPTSGHEEVAKISFTFPKQKTRKTLQQKQKIFYGNFGGVIIKIFANIEISLWGNK